MTAPDLRESDWLEVLERDYLGSFIREGGAVVKVAVVAPEQVPSVSAQIRTIAERNGFPVAEVGAEVARVYYMDRLFNSVASQIDWRELAQRLMRRALVERGYTLPDGSLELRRVAAANQVEVGQVQVYCEQFLAREVLRDYALARDFRVAMAHLCMAAVEPDDLRLELAERILEWLRGELRTITALRRAQIFERINRYSARALLNSTVWWARRTGNSGLVVCVDVSRLASSKPRPGPEGTMLRPPSRMAVADTYEMMRQCLDGTDEAEGLLLVFLVGQEFVTDERRGMRIYPALELRLTDDVHDRSRANPFAPMVRLGQL